MLDRLMNQVNFLEKGLDAAALNNDCIAGNIANADTVGYHSKSVNFESVFQEALDAGSFSAGLKDMPEFRVTENSATSIRMDGNNVDIDAEMASLAENAVLYEALTYSVSKELGRIRLVINEGR